jgi:hypothetical protein
MIVLVMNRKEHMMVMSERSTVVGVFTEDLYANLAADELRRVGFSDDEISVSRHKEESGTLAGLRRLFKGQEATPVATADDFIRMGVPVRDAQYYQSEFDAGHTIVLVRVADQQQQALEILRKNGGMTSRSSNQSVQGETDQSPVAPDMYDPVSNRDAGESKMTPDEPH